MLRNVIILVGIMYQTNDGGNLFGANQNFFLNRLPNIVFVLEMDSTDYKLPQFKGFSA